MERQTVLRIHLLAEALDGGIVPDQLRVWERIALVMVGSRAPAAEESLRSNDIIHATSILVAEIESN